MAALQILGQAGSRRPVVACVDDAHWLDRASVHVLAAVGTGYQTPIGNAGIRARPGSEALLKDEQEFVQASRSSALIQMNARLDEVLIAS